MGGISDSIDSHQPAPPPRSSRYIAKEILIHCASLFDGVWRASTFFIYWLDYFWVDRSRKASARTKERKTSSSVTMASFFPPIFLIGQQLFDIQQMVHSSLSWDQLMQHHPSKFPSSQENKQPLLLFLVKQIWCDHTATVVVVIYQGKNSGPTSKRNVRPVSSGKQSERRRRRNNIRQSGTQKRQGQPLHRVSSVLPAWIAHLTWISDHWATLGRPMGNSIF